MCSWQDLSLDFHHHASPGLARRGVYATALSVKTQNLGGKLYLVFIGLAVAGMGGIFVAWLWKGYASARETRQWQEVSATVLESAVQDRVLGPQIPREYSLKLMYEYPFNGKSYLGERLKLRENPWAKEKARAKGIAEQFRIGQEVTAYVNPADPSQAVLQHETKAPLYSIWFPCLFVIAGLGIAVKALLIRPSAEA